MAALAGPPEWSQEELAPLVGRVGWLPAFSCGGGSGTVLVARCVYLEASGQCRRPRQGPTPIGPNPEVVVEMYVCAQEGVDSRSMFVYVCVCVFATLEAQEA